MGAQSKRDAASGTGQRSSRCRSGETVSPAGRSRWSLETTRLPNDRSETPLELSDESHGAGRERGSDGVVGPEPGRTGLRELQAPKSTHCRTRGSRWAGQRTPGIENTS